MAIPRALVRDVPGIHSFVPPRAGASNTLRCRRQCSSIKHLRFSRSWNMSVVRSTLKGVTHLSASSGVFPLVWGSIPLLSALVSGGHVFGLSCPCLAAGSLPCRVCIFRISCERRWSALRFSWSWYCCSPSEGGCPTFPPILACDMISPCIRCKAALATPSSPAVWVTSGFPTIPRLIGHVDGCFLIQSTS